MITMQHWLQVKPMLLTVALAQPVRGLRAHQRDAILIAKGKYTVSSAENQQCVLVCLNSTN